VSMQQVFWVRRDELHQMFGCQPDALLAHGTRSAKTRVREETCPAA
jgi:hypothetical protein